MVTGIGQIGKSLRERWCMDGERPRSRKLLYRHGVVRKTEEIRPEVQGFETSMVKRTLCTQKATEEIRPEVQGFETR
jgi:hypothetical protein